LRASTTDAADEGAGMIGPSGVCRYTSEPTPRPLETLPLGAPAAANSRPAIDPLCTARK